MTGTKRNAIGAVTAAHDFNQIVFEGEKLFSVREGVPLSEAFEKLTELLTACHDNLYTLADHTDASNATGGLWASIHLLSLCCELVDSMHQGHSTAVQIGAAL